MRSVKRFFRRRAELSSNEERRRSVQEDLQRHYAFPVRVVPAQTKGGFDEIYYVNRGREHIGVARVNSETRESNKKPILKDSVIVSLSAHERLRLEWNAYSVLYKQGLSPKPIWRNEIAIVCEWLPWERVSRRVIRDRASFWGIAEKVFHVTQQMHSCGIQHMDLNLGNLMINKEGTEIKVIDFEYGAARGMTKGQQRMYDYLRLINDFTRRRRGGKIVLSDPERFVSIVESFIVPDDINVCCGVLIENLKGIRKHKSLRRSLSIILPNLEN